MDNNTISAIIGFWRMGATMEEMVGVTGLNNISIQEIIKTYRNVIFQ